MKTTILESELILNDDGSIYHLKLKPGELAKDIITVGDQNRVDMVAQHFDSILLKKSNREFYTITGEIGGKPISVISTGIGTDNIDIVFNEIDALFNIDFNARQINDNHTQLNFYRIGTSGTIQKEIEIDSFIVSEMAVGFDSLGNFYLPNERVDEALYPTVKSYIDSEISALKDKYYIVESSKSLLEIFSSYCKKGYTLTMPGFYAPQGRNIRASSSVKQLINKLANADFENNQFTNIEMETAGIYLLSQLLNHNAISLNAILANRVNGEFSKTPQKTIEKLIELTLEKITQMA